MSTKPKIPQGRVHVTSGYGLKIYVERGHPHPDDLRIPYKGPFSLKTLVLRIDKSLVFILIDWIIMIPFVIVGCLKGRYVLSIVGVFVLLGIPAILAATRLARPDSVWAKRFYDEDKLIRTGHRYPGNSNISDAFML